MLKDEWESTQSSAYSHTHRHCFTDNPSRETRKAWLDRQFENIASRGGDISVIAWRETADGYEFGFEDFESYAAFRLSVLGDEKTNRGHRCTQVFDNGVNPYWVKAAQMYLDHLRIDYDMQVIDNEVTFAFDRFSESALLRLMIDSEGIDHMARTLERSDTIMHFMRTRMEPPGPSADGMSFSM